MLHVYLIICPGKLIFVKRGFSGKYKLFVTAFEGECRIIIELCKHLKVSFVLIASEAMLPHIIIHVNVISHFCNSKGELWLC